MLLCFAEITPKDFVPFEALRLLLLGAQCGDLGIRAPVPGRHSGAGVPKLALRSAGAAAHGGALRGERCAFSASVDGVVATGLVEDDCFGGSEY